MNNLTVGHHIAQIPVSNFPPGNSISGELFA